MLTSGLGLSRVMVPHGPWSLERGKGGPAGNWSRPALEARYSTMKKRQNWKNAKNNFAWSFP